MSLFAILRDDYSVSQAAKDKNAAKPTNADFMMKIALLSQFVK